LFFHDIIIPILSCRVPFSNAPYIGINKNPSKQITSYHLKIKSFIGLRIEGALENGTLQCYQKCHKMKYFT